MSETSNAERREPGRIEPDTLGIGAAGLAFLIGLTVLRFDQLSEAIEAAGAVVILVLFIATMALQLLRFEAELELPVPFELTLFAALVPLTGPLPAIWLGIAGITAGRYLAALQKDSPPSLRGVLISLLGAAALIAFPILVASSVYSWLGGTTPPSAPWLETMGRVLAGGVALIVTHFILATLPPVLRGEPVLEVTPRMVRSAMLLLLTLPYAVCMAVSSEAIGILALLAFTAELIVAYGVACRMALEQGASRRLVQRLASLNNIGQTISLTTNEKLMQTLYHECRQLVDASVFSMAILDERSGDLRLELFVANGVAQPRTTIPPGKGLNWWVVNERQPLLLRSSEQDRDLGITPFDDGIRTESWLGVPMIARDRVIGVISVQSPKKNAFTNDDVLLLTAIANQAAVAIDNSGLVEELEDLNWALEERVQARTNELAVTNVQLLAANHTKNEFLAKMSHELRTPLNSIIGFSSVLLKPTKETLPPRLYKFLENIEAAGTHLLGLINDILDLSKIEAGKMELRPDRFDLRETVSGVERVMKGLASDAQVRITTHVDPSVPLVTLDEGRLKQILFNLLSNAVKFSPQGGTVSIDVSAVGSAESPLGFESIRITVSDKGIGIAMDDLRKIFEEFYQTHQTRRVKGGTGLGLSLTRNFVELHHGTIEVRSAPNEGSVFTLYLPVDYFEASASPGKRELPLIRHSASQQPS